MLDLLKSIKEDEFKSMVRIQVNSENIDDYYINNSYGFLDVFDHVLSCDEADVLFTSFEEHNLKYEDRYVEFINDVYELNKSKPIVVEMYLNELSNVEILRILNILDYKDKLIFLELVRNIENSYYLFLIQSSVILPLLIRLSTRELLFTTFYFTEIPISIVGNFDLSFPIFFENPNDICTYLDISKETNLFLRNIKIN